MASKKTEEEKAKEKLAALLGIDIPTDEEHIQEARQEEAVIEHIKHPEKFIRRNCENCKEEFAVNRMNVAHCGDWCRSETLRRFGIKRTKQPRGAWDEEWVWNVYWGNEPLVVPPDALKMLDKREASLGNLDVTESTVVDTQENVETTSEFSDLSKKLAQFGISSKEPISQEATDLTEEVGKVASVDNGIEVGFFEGLDRLLGN